MANAGILTIMPTTVHGVATGRAPGGSTSTVASPGTRGIHHLVHGGGRAADEEDDGGGGGRGIGPWRIMMRRMMRRSMMRRTMRMSMEEDDEEDEKEEDAE